jgi:hypothetical protein
MHKPNKIATYPGVYLEGVAFRDDHWDAQHHCRPRLELLSREAGSYSFCDADSDSKMTMILHREYLRSGLGFTAQ